MAHPLAFVRAMLPTLWQGPVVLFLLNFGLGKGLAFAGPVWLGLVLSPETYGLIEFALASAGFAVIFLTFGVPQAAMQLVQMRQGRPVADLLAVTSALVASAACLAATALTLAHQPKPWIFAAAVLALSALQQGASAFARAKGMRNLTAWADHIHIILIVVAATLLFLLAKPVNEAILLDLLIGLGAAGAVASFAAFQRNREPLAGARLAEAARIGLPMLASSLCFGWIVASGRIFVEHFLTKADLYAYSFSFRVGSVLLLMHAVANTAFAARLYGMPTRQFDQIAAYMILALGAAALAFSLFTPQIWLANFASSENAGLLSQRAAIALVPAQVFFWGAGAFVEMRLSRVRRAGAMVPRSLVILGMTAAIIFGLAEMGWLNFSLMLALLTAQQALICGAIHWVLARRGVPLRHAALATFGAGALVLLAAGLVILWH